MRLMLPMSDERRMELWLSESWEEQVSSAVSTILNTIHEKLDDVVCVGEEIIVVDGQQALSFEWEGYGLKMEIPALAAGQSGAPPLEIGLVALISGPFEFPPDTQLVSGVYAIASSRKPRQPVLLLMEHCVDLQDSQEDMPLRFVRASCSQPTRPYQFEYLDHGEFPINSRHGSIQLERFSLFASVYTRIVNYFVPDQSLVYKAHIYREQEASRRWMIILAVAKAIPIYEQQIKKYYANATSFTTFEFEFADKEIQLVLEEKKTVDNWTISLRSYPCFVQQKAVNNWEAGQEPINRKITVRAGPDATPELSYHVPITGTCKDDCSFLIECDLSDSTIPATAAARVSETSGQSSSTVISTSRHSPGQPVVIDTTIQAMAAASISESSSHSSSGTTPGQSTITGTASQPMATTGMSEASGHGTVNATSGISPDDSTSDKPLTMDDDWHDVRQALDEFDKTEWTALGKELGLKPNLLREIRDNCKPYNAGECCDRVLEAWLKQSHDEAKFGLPTWDRLAKAVKKSGNPALAKRILALHAQK